MKKCRICGEIKSLGEFSKSSVRSDGIRSECKSCCNKADKKLREGYKSNNLIVRVDLSSKKCGVCKEVKDIKHFGNYINSKDGYHSLCRVCVSAHQKKQRENNKIKNKNRTDNFKICRTCGNKKSSDEFHKSISTPSGLAPLCKICEKEKKRVLYVRDKEKINMRRNERYSLNKEEINKKRRESNHKKGVKAREFAKIGRNKYIESPVKKCPECNKTKQKSDFTIARRNLDGCYHICRECHNRIAREKYKQNPEKINQYNLKSYRKNRDEIIKRNRIKYQENKDEILAKRKVYMSSPEMKKKKYQWDRKYYLNNIDKIREAGKEYTEKNKEKISKYKGDWAKEQSMNLTDSYIKTRLTSKSLILKSEDIPQEMIESKRILMQIDRYIKKQRS